MRTLTTVLAICGGIWALSGIAGWFLTLESFLYVETGKDLLISLVTVVLLTSGYFVWWGWASQLSAFQGWQEWCVTVRRPEFVRTREW